MTKIVELANFQTFKTFFNFNSNSILDGVKFWQKKIAEKNGFLNFNFKLFVNKKKVKLANVQTFNKIFNFNSI